MSATNDSSDSVDAHPIPKQIGRYQIEAELGRGAMGVVYRAQDPMLTRKVAIKTILLSSDPDERADYETRFATEAKAAGGMSHPNIITIYDLGREGDLAYMAMELLEGKELRQLLDTEQIRLRTALDYAVQMVEGIAYAHDRGVIHRDLKPANIMILDNGLAKIMDFGIARLRSATSRTRTGLMLGSPKYMAPEQIAGKSLDHRCDIFSLGVLLYEMTTGFAPFFSPDVNQLMYQVCNNEQRPPSQINPAVPPMLDLILAKALAKNPADRYPDAHQFAADLVICRDEVAANPVDDLASQSMRHVIGPAPGSESAGATAKAASDGAEAAAPAAVRPVVSSLNAPGELAVRFSVSRKYDATEALAALGKSRVTRRRLSPGRLRLWFVYLLAVAAAVGIVYY